MVWRALPSPAGGSNRTPRGFPARARRSGAGRGGEGSFRGVVPGLTVVPAIVSGVLSPTALRNPLIFLRRKREDREWLAATLQMMTPMLRNVTTRVAFGQPVRVEDPSGRVVDRAVQEEARCLIERCKAR